MPPNRRSPGGPSAPRAGEIYFEFYRLGPAIKVTAVDATTGLEVSIMGPASAAQSDLEAVALRKLDASNYFDLRRGVGDETGCAA